MNRAIKIAMFTCLPPIRSGIAKYSLDLIKHLKKDFQIDIFVENIPAANRENVYSHLEFSIKNNQNAYKIIIYQMGNNIYHHFQYPYIFNFPGLIIFHDLVLSHSFTKYYIQNNLVNEYIEQMYLYYGENGKRIAQIFTQNPMPLEFQSLLMFFFPMNKKIIVNSTAIAVHDLFHYKYLKYQFPEKRIYYIPMGIDYIYDEISNMNEEDLKNELYLPKDCFLLGSIGFLNRYKGVKAILKAIRELLKIFNIKFIWIGEDNENLFKNLVEEEGLQDSCLITGYVEERTMMKYIKAMDIIINMRYPTAGEFPHTLLMAFKLGKATIISNLPHLYQIPPTITMKIRLDKEVEALTEAISFLLSNENERKKMGEAAKIYVEKNHTIEAMVNAYKMMILEELRYKWKQDCN